MTTPNDQQPSSNVAHLRTASAGGYGPGHTGARPRPDFAAASAHKPKFVAKGHDAQLQDAQLGKLLTILTLVSGERYEGFILKRDKFTITLAHSGGDEIFYKHAIEGVLIKRSAN